MNSDKYTVISPPDKEGSVLENGNFSKQREGVPGCWMLDVQEDATVKRTLVPSTGMLVDLLKISTGSVSDSKIDAIRSLNPGKYFKAKESEHHVSWKALVD